MFIVFRKLPRFYYKFNSSLSRQRLISSTMTFTYESLHKLAIELRKRLKQLLTLSSRNKAFATVIKN